MLRILFLAALIWWGGRFMGLPRNLRIAVLAVLFAAVLTVQLTLPAAHPLREGTGGSVAAWLLLGGLAIIAGFYARIVSALKSRAQPRTRPHRSPPAVFLIASWTATPATSCCARSAVRDRKS